MHVVLRVHGKVQGVGFRSLVSRLAKRAGLGGWALNEPQGTVRVCVCGDRAHVSGFISDLRRLDVFAGPKVDRVEVVEEREECEEACADGRFAVRY